MRNKLVLCWILFLQLAACGQDATEQQAFNRFLRSGGPEVDLWISGARVFTGQDTTVRPADILVRDDSIAFVGWVDGTRVQADRHIDAQGKWVSPGFIDTHAHGDPIGNPAFANFLAMGVTTICLGQDGGSPRMTNLDAWMQRAEAARPGVNIALFVGHGTLRHLSGVGYTPDPEEAQMQRMEELLRQALEAGCFGMSTGLEYTPGIYAGEAELHRLARLVGQYDGLIMSHMRNEDDDAIEASLRELLGQGQFCDVHASHLKVVYGKGAERAEAILALLDSARQAAPHAVTADVYPYMASYTGIGIVFPTWAKAPNDYQAVVRNRREELLEALRTKVIARNGPEATLLGSAPYAGKTLAQLAAEQGKPFEEVLLDMGPRGASGAYFVMDEALQTRLIQDPHVMICSDGSPSMHHPRGYGSFAKIIETYVRERASLTLPQALYKMTALPARTLGLQDRGQLRAGAKADLLVFDPAQVEAPANFTEPKQLARGFELVLVNGEIALERGTPTSTRPGRVLRAR